jgi:osmotically-inducible protein OsmY
MSLLADAGLTFKIKAALIADERVHAGDINVNTEDGVVRLQGRVPFEAIRDVAEAVAVRNGAHRVVNELTVENDLFATPSVIIPDDAPHVTASSGAEPVQEAPLVASIKAALATDSRVNEHLINVHVENHMAYLTGRQDTIDQVKLATEIAAHVPGVMAVSNDVEVLPSV